MRWMMIPCLIWMGYGCRGTVHTSDQLSEKAPIDRVYEASVYAIIDTIMAGVHGAQTCDIAATFVTAEEQPGCNTAVLKHVCGLQLDKASNVAKITLSGQEIEKRFTQFTGPVINRFRAALIDCVKAAAVQKVAQVAVETGLTQSSVYTSVIAESVQAAAADAAVEAATDATTRAAVSAASEGATSAVIDATTDTAANSAATATGAAMRKGVWLRAVGFAACRGAAAAIGASIDAYYAEDQKANAQKYECSNVRDWLNESKTWSSCSRSVGSLCALATLRGAVDVSNFLPTLDSDAAKIGCSASQRYCDRRLFTWSACNQTRMQCHQLCCGSN
jgi:hypothetical protein